MIAPLGILVVCYESVLLGIQTFGNGQLSSSASVELVLGSQDPRWGAVSAESQTVTGGLKLPFWARTGFAVGLTLSVKVFPWFWSQPCLSWPGVLGFFHRTHPLWQEEALGREGCVPLSSVLPSCLAAWQTLLACSGAGICSLLTLRSQEREL